MIPLVRDEYSCVYCNCFTFVRQERQLYSLKHAVKSADASGKPNGLSRSSIVSLRQVCMNSALFAGRYG